MRALPAAVLLLMLALAPSAVAAPRGQGPVNPAVSQYVEMIPTASGQRPVSATQTRPTAPVRPAAVPPAATATPATTTGITPVSPPQTVTKHHASPQHAKRQRHRPATAPTTTKPTRAARSLKVASPSFGTSAFGSVGSGGAWLVVLLLAAVLAPVALAVAHRRRA